MGTFHQRCGLPGLLFIVLATSAFADVVFLNPAKDATLHEEGDSLLANGSGHYFFVGRNNGGSRRRSLIAFDFSSIPSGSVVNDASLTLFMSRTITGPQIIEMHRVSPTAAAVWSEGPSDPPMEEGSGAASMPGDATWVHTEYNTRFWANPGGDFTATVSAQAVVDTIGMYMWAGAQLTADVQSMVEVDLGTGWILIGPEAGFPTTKRFNSRENPSSPPVLEIDFTPPDTIPTGLPAERTPTAVLQGGYPNPFADESTIPYSLGEPAEVTISVHDVRGRLVRVLVHEIRPAAAGVTIWNGHDSRGDPSPSGVYFVRLVAGSHVVTKKLVLLR